MFRHCSGRLQQRSLSDECELMHYSGWSLELFSHFLFRIKETLFNFGYLSLYYYRRSAVRQTQPWSLQPVSQCEWMSAREFDLAESQLTANVNHFVCLYVCVFFCTCAFKIYSYVFIVVLSFNVVLRLGCVYVILISFPVIDCAKVFVVCISFLKVFSLLMLILYEPNLYAYVKTSNLHVRMFADS